MEQVWCWRCRKWVQALDESEFAPLEKLIIDCSKEARKASEWGKPLEQVQARFASVLAAHEKLTGDRDLKWDEIAKHRIGEFGPPCEGCGKNLRTPLASKCFECGHVVAK
jgi:hypothetical protein